MTQYIAKTRGVDPNNASKSIGPQWGKIIWREVKFDNFPNFGTLVGCVVHTNGACNGNFITRESGVHRFKGQIYVTPPYANSKVSLYLSLVKLGFIGTGFEIVQVANEEVPPGQHPSLSIDTMVEAEAGEYFAFFWYYLDSTGIMKTLGLQTEHIYCFAEVEKLT